MKRLVWILVVTYVGLAAGLFYSLAIEAPDLFLLLAALLFVLAVPQWVILSRRASRLPDAELSPQDRS